MKRIKENIKKQVKSIKWGRVVITIILTLLVIKGLVSIYSDIENMINSEVEKRLIEYRTSTLTVDPIIKK